MKIQPSQSKVKPVAPAIMAMIGALLTGCDKQGVPGDVPRRIPGEPAEQHLVGSEPAKPAPEQTEPEEHPQALGGDVPVENIFQDE